MTDDRLSVTVPSELGTAVRKLAAQRRVTVSALIADALEHRVRAAAFDAALAQADREHGPIDAELVRDAKLERPLGAHASRLAAPVNHLDSV